MRLRLIATICIALTALPALAAAPGYKIIHRYALGGEGGWDYLTVDANARRFYISRSTHVMVIDADSGKPVGDIPDTQGVHGVALAPDLGRGFTSNGRESTVTIFDITSLKPITKVKVGQKPDAILYDPATKQVFTFNAGSQDATVIDAAKGEVVGTIPLGGKPEFAASDEKGMVFVNLEDKNQLFAIDANQRTVKSRWKLPGCEEPSGLAIDKAHGILFAGCGNKVMAIVNAESGKTIATLPIGDGVDATAFDAGTGLAFASCGEGVLSVIHEDSATQFSVVESAPTQKGARTMALDTRTHNVFTVTAKFGPPPPATPQQPHPYPSVVKDTFEVLVLSRP